MRKNKQEEVIKELEMTIALLENKINQLQLENDNLLKLRDNVLRLAASPDKYSLIDNELPF